MKNNKKDIIWKSLFSPIENNNKIIEFKNPLNHPVNHNSVNDEVNNNLIHNTKNHNIKSYLNKYKGIKRLDLNHKWFDDPNIENWSKDLEVYFSGLMDACGYASFKLNYNKSNIKIFIPLDDTESNRQLLNTFMFRLGGEIISDPEESIIKLCFTKRSEIIKVLAVLSVNPLFSIRGNHTLNNIKNCLLNPDAAISIPVINKENYDNFPQSNFFITDSKLFWIWFLGFIEGKGKFRSSGIYIKVDYRLYFTMFNHVYGKPDDYSLFVEKYSENKLGTCDFLLEYRNLHNFFKLNPKYCFLGEARWLYDDMIEYKRIK